MHVTLKPKTQVLKQKIYILQCNFHPLQSPPHPSVFSTPPPSHHAVLISILLSAPVLMDSGGSLFRKNPALDQQHVLEAADFSSFLT